MDKENLPAKEKIHISEDEVKNAPSMKSPGRDPMDYQGSTNVGKENVVQSDGFNWRMFAILSAGVFITVVGILIWRIVSDQPPPPPEHTSVYQKEAWERIQPHLAQADKQTQDATNVLIGRIEQFFEARKTGASAFAEAALGWKSKWELIKSREGHREFLAEKFSEYIFSAEDLDAFLKQASEEYAQNLEAVENDFLVRVRADLRDMPASAFPAFADEELLRKKFREIVRGVHLDVTKDIYFDFGKGVTSFAVGEVVAVVVTKTVAAIASRMGLSTAILGSGAASSAATFGAGIVIAIAVDFLLEQLIGWFHDPVENLTGKVVDNLDLVSSFIIIGDPEAREVYNRVNIIAENDPELRLREKAKLVSDKIEQSGGLGLQFTLGKVASLQGRLRQLAMEKLVYQGVH